ncbi:MAG TPA: AbrB/MazE/SpoVT family DNA-binding domain-containing protein [Candidatus Thermoplasmatota archaeon]|nr:AbrB/MazE/SpoVT family DNA-binding domain-containing protein [Candidatus Thermoplasmatota archaeon]
MKVNDRGQVVIPEDVRLDLRIDANTTLVLIERGDEIVLRKEAAVLDEIEGFWRHVSRDAIAKAWGAEDDAWDDHYVPGAA